MATAPKISSHLECNICRDRYKQPKILDCKHSFCESCLEKYYTSRYKGKRKIPCPVCQRETVLPKKHIQGLKTNVHLMGIVEDVLLQERTPEKNESQCQKHMGEMQRFYCETCDELICQDCIVVDHCKPKHQYVESGEASLKHKESLKDMFADFTTDIERLEHALATSSQAEQRFAEDVTKIVKAVQDKADKMRAEITTQETKMIQEIKQLKQDRNRAYDEHQKALKMMVQSKKHFLGTSQDIINTASDTEFLSLYPIISKDLKSPKNQNPPQLDPKLSYLSFTPSKRIGDINLGKLEVEAAKWEMCHEFGKEGSGPGVFKWARSSTATQPGEIAVTDWGDNRVVICSNEGQHKGAIPLQGKFLSYPWAVAAIHNPAQSLVALDKSKHVKVFNMKDNTLAMQFSTVEQSQVDKTQVELRSVVIKRNGTILVGDVKRMVWTEHRPIDGEILRTVPVQVPPWYLAVDDDTDRVVVSGRETKKVDVADSKGTTLRTIEPTINGKPVWSCRGVCCDSSGIYLAMLQSVLGTGHIHHYDIDGRFLDCLAHDLFDPCGIALTSDGQLAVPDGHSVKMYHKV
ncbi:E3 ubiquitin-protein ligase TRIM56-like [Patiria miniata]|uniref:Tripartite motif-containing protein 3 n=1 Tax=Patiria miniata TaxID=46514 RepID=A0A914AGW3_PATMI|nr:E3 ubiquitin-protein ligase TRIM56-like [Patiria miniata]